MTQKVIWHPNVAPSFLLLHVITNEKTWKLKQIDRLPALPRFSPQKHVPTTLVGIPVDIYTLGVCVRYVKQDSHAGNCGWISIYHKRRFHITDIKDILWQYKMFKLLSWYIWEWTLKYICILLFLWYFRLKTTQSLALCHSIIHELVHSQYQLACTCYPFKYVYIRMKKIMYSTQSVLATELACPCTLLCIGATYMGMLPWPNYHSSCTCGIELARVCVCVCVYIYILGLIYINMTPK